MIFLLTLYYKKILNVRKSWKNRAGNTHKLSTQVPGPVCSSLAWPSSSRSLATPSFCVSGLSPEPPCSCCFTCCWKGIIPQDGEWSGLCEPPPYFSKHSSSLGCFVPWRLFSEVKLFASLWRNGLFPLLSSSHQHRRVWLGWSPSDTSPHPSLSRWSLRLAPLCRESI